jgi:hypothetical protein
MPATSLPRSSSRYVPYAHDHLGCFDSLDLLTASGSVAEYAALDLPATRYILQITQGASLPETGPDFADGFVEWRYEQPGRSGDR